MSDNVQKINQHLRDILGVEKGYFGRISTWGQRPNEYKQIGFVPTEDFEPILSSMTDEQRKNLVMIMTYFEIHARPLKNLLNAHESEQLYKLYSEIAWSHFATVVMFGMLEAATKGKKGLWLRGKGAKIKKFLEDNLPQETKDSVVRQYSTEQIFNHKKHGTFGEVIDHLWGNVRGDFVHDIGLESKGLEYGTLIGMGTKDDPIRNKTDVPMPEWLRLTWQAILNSYGYKGKLEHPKLNRTIEG
ncbi:MAG: hypothetical protein U1A26_03020, partial [Candidatus Sungbacteria bacterium]|nr:hypothetical protein [Candidatus Sungbacteria bacterium]